GEKARAGEFQQVVPDQPPLIFGPPALNQRVPCLSVTSGSVLEEGWEIDPEDLAHISPYLTEHIKRFGEYSTHELGIQPDAYDPKLDVDFSPLHGDHPESADGYGQAA
ncbi:Tn3 family transposase, partial [Streptomyces flaveus]|uniref:Tn3 family transposase n=1 Tax=Streptomyces flaveus TaxID=66370 RepID=UPI001671755E